MGTGRISNREYFERVMSEVDKRYQQRFDAQNLALNEARDSAANAVQSALVAAEKAVAKAELAAEKRFDSVNEFRAAYQDLISLQMPRKESEQAFSTLQSKLDELRDFYLTRHSELVTRVDKIEGRSSGLNSGWIYLLGLLGLVSTVMTIYALLKR
jgi:HD-GYP domain-containing protein (c-di-GMP phosphodiesterase class II)